jgi:hypothetical protein
VHWAEFGFNRPLNTLCWSTENTRIRFTIISLDNPPKTIGSTQEQELRMMTCDHFPAIGAGNPRDRVGPWRTLARYLTFSAALILGALAGHAGIAEEPNAAETAKADPSDEALKAVDRFMAAFNSADSLAWARTLQYPHIRIAQGQINRWETPESYAKGFDFDTFRRETSWHHSRFDQRRVVQTSPTKVHVAVQFTRYRKDGTKIATYQAMYVVVLKGGRWGIQARSSFAP